VSPRLRRRRRRAPGPCDSCRPLYARYPSRALDAGHPGGALAPRHPRHTCRTRDLTPKRTIKSVV
jgi:hypothetical protein